MKAEQSEYSLLETASGLFLVALGVAIYWMVRIASLGKIDLKNK